MPHDRFFVDTIFQKHDQVKLKEEVRHLKVMRIRDGEEIELVNGKNQLAISRYHSPNIAKILHVESFPKPFPLILCQALPRLSRLDTIVEKCTELGMTELWLFPGVLSEKKHLTPSQLERLRHITIASLKQCGRFDLPKIEIKPPLLEWKEVPHPAYFGDLSPSAPSFFSSFEVKNLSFGLSPSDSEALENEEKITKTQVKKEMCFFVGPEAGFAEVEEIHLKKMGAKGVKLHPWILRADTAPIVVLSTVYAKLSLCKQGQPKDLG